PSIHLGRAIPLWKLRALQDLGHEAILIIGDFTAQVGDPSDKIEKRPMLGEAEIERNMKTYKAQIGKILDLKKTKFAYNSKWLSKLTFADTAELAESFSVLQMSNRRNFKERLDRGEEVSLREFLYPLMQGYDSMAVKADLELGGFDQLFNLKAGRIIQRHYKMKEQDILTTVMLEGTDGRKMSSSWGNVINIADEPSDMFGKTMSLRDELIVKYFTLATQLPLAEITTIERSLKEGENPRDAKLRLAHEIVKLYHGATAADDARDDFITKFKDRGVPSDVPEIKTKLNAPLRETLVAAGIVASNSEFFRLCQSGAITVVESGRKIIGPDAKIDGSATLRIGKHRFVKIVIN
ncbi:tyrosine--tRNA ligase, partial [Candidatus Parcubacteria bacterium]|nr:tyrosine--tRNA ligase [Candidatus Parcubacteria bacterium]